MNKFDSKAQKCLMLGYSECSKGYRVYNIETWIVEESIGVRFDDKLGSQKSKCNARNLINYLIKLFLE